MEFNPENVRGQFKLACEKFDMIKKPTSNSKKKQHAFWEEKLWSEESIETRVKAWISKGCQGSREQMVFVAHALAYVALLVKAKDAYQDKPLPLEFPIYGPLFTPPTIATESLAGRSVSSRRLEYLVEPVLVVHEVYYPHHHLDRCLVQGCSSGVTRNGFTDTGFGTAYGVHSNIKTIEQRFVCKESEHSGWSTTSKAFWETRRSEIFMHNDVPLFLYQKAACRELYDLVTELRMQTSVHGMTESVHQLHMLHTHRLRQKYMDALDARLGNPTQPTVTAHFTPPLLLPFPDRIAQCVVIDDKAVGGTTKTLEINPSPSATLVRELYEIYAEYQAISEVEAQ